jgi:hypothetical protein
MACVMVPDGKSGARVSPARYLPKLKASEARPGFYEFSQHAFPTTKMRRAPAPFARCSVCATTARCGRSASAGTSPRCSRVSPARFAEVVPVDCFLLTGRYTLLDQGALHAVSNFAARASGSLGLNSSTPSGCASRMGARSAEEVADNIALAERPVPPSFWRGHCSVKTDFWRSSLCFWAEAAIYYRERSSNHHRTVNVGNRWGATGRR